MLPVEPELSKEELVKVLEGEYKRALKLVCNNPTDHFSITWPITARTHDDTIVSTSLLRS